MSTWWIANSVVPGVTVRREDRKCAMSKDGPRDRRGCSVSMIMTNPCHFRNSSYLFNQRTDFSISDSLTLCFAGCVPHILRKSILYVLQNPLWILAITFDDPQVSLDL